jgi:hypothetical protein
MLLQTNVKENRFGEFVEMTRRTFETIQGLFEAPICVWRCRWATRRRAANVIIKSIYML